MNQEMWATPSISQAKHSFKTNSRTNYAAALNYTLILLKTKPASEALEKICGPQGLCHQKGLCNSLPMLSFYWLLCKNHVPHFAQLPCIAKNAKKVGFNPAANAFEEHEDQTPLEYLQTNLWKPVHPHYMQYMVAKLVAEIPVNYLQETESLHRTCCSRYPKMCQQPRPPALKDDKH